MMYGVAKFVMQLNCAGDVYCETELLERLSCTIRVSTVYISQQALQVRYAMLCCEDCAKSAS